MKQLSTYVCEDFKISKNTKFIKGKNVFEINNGFHKFKATFLTFRYAHENIFYDINEMNDNELKDFLTENNKWDWIGDVFIEIQLEENNKFSSIHLLIRYTQNDVKCKFIKIVNSHDISNRCFYDVVNIATHMYVENYIDSIEKQGIDLEEEISKNNLD